MKKFQFLKKLKKYEHFSHVAKLQVFCSGFSLGARVFFLINRSIVDRCYYIVGVLN
jgi:hypothetical protein